MAAKPPIIEAFEKWGARQGLFRSRASELDSLTGGIVASLVHSMRSSLGAAPEASENAALELLRDLARRFPSRFTPADNWMFCESSYSSEIELFLQCVVAEALCEWRNQTAYGPGSVLVRCVPLGGPDAFVAEVDGLIFIVVSNELIAFLWIYNWAVMELLRQATNKIGVPGPSVRVSNTVGARLVATYLLQNKNRLNLTLPFMSVALCLLEEGNSQVSESPLQNIARLVAEICDAETRQFAKHLLTKGHVGWKDGVDRRMSSLKFYGLMHIVLHELCHPLLAVMNTEEGDRPRTVGEEANVDTWATIFLEDAVKRGCRSGEPIGATLGPALFLSAIRLFVFLDFDRKSERVSKRAYSDLDSVFGEPLVGEQHVLDQRIGYLYMTRMLRGDADQEELARLFRAILEFDVYNLFFVSPFVDVDPARRRQGKIQLHTEFPPFYLDLINNSTVAHNESRFKSAKNGLQAIIDAIKAGKIQPSWCQVKGDVLEVLAPEAWYLSPPAGAREPSAEH